MAVKVGRSDVCFMLTWACSLKAQIWIQVILFMDVIILILAFNDRIVVNNVNLTVLAERYRNPLYLTVLYYLLAVWCWWLFLPNPFPHADGCHSAPEIIIKRKSLWKTHRGNLWCWRKLLFFCDKWKCQLQFKATVVSLSLLWFGLIIN